MTARLALAILVALFAAPAAWGPASLAVDAFAGAVGAQASQAASSVDLKVLIGNLASLDYATRTHAARLIRRAPAAEAVPALTDAARRHPDEFVRHRAFVLLTAFGDRGTPALVADLLRDRNDRLREAAYKWLEQHPEPRLTDTLLAALQAEQAEFVRPALVGALAAVDDNAQVQRALVGETLRGLDFFREAAIEALGRQQAQYAIDTLAGITKLEGPLRDSAILALGRIGGAKPRAILNEIAGAPGDSGRTLRAALCLAGERCEESLKALSQAAASASSDDVRSAMTALSAIGSSGNDAATAAVVGLAARGGVIRDQAAVAFGAIALRRPDGIVSWLGAAPDGVRASAIDLLKEGFERLEEDFAEEQFYAAARAAYWKGAENSPARALSATIIQKLEF